jgi:hypothetical protein
MKLILCFEKCREYRISLNLEKCAFMVFLRLILGFIASKEGKIPDSKKVQAIMKYANTYKPTTYSCF